MTQEQALKIMLGGVNVLLTGPCWCRQELLIS